MKRRLKGRLLAAGGALLMLAAAGCSSDADVASENLSKAADNFEIQVFKPEQVLPGCRLPDRVSFGASETAELWSVLVSPLSCGSYSKQT